MKTIRLPRRSAWIWGLCLLLPLFAHASLEEIEAGYFEAYDKLHQQATRFHQGLTGITAPEGHRYGEGDLVEYRAQLEALYTKKPKYREMVLADAKKKGELEKQIADLVGADESDIGRYEAAYYISRMAGLPHRELAVVQKAGGLSSLRKLIWSVKNLPNRQWISWYLMLINHGGDTAQKSLFLDDGADHPEVAALRAEYGAHAKAFNQARGRLKAAESAALKAATEPSEKSRIAVKLFIHANISKKAGRVGWGYDNRGGYPLEAPKEARYSKAAQLADRLGVPFADLAFIKKAEGNYGLRKVVKGMAWVADREAILSEVFE